MKSLRSLAVVLPVYAVIVSWSLMAQGQGQAPVQEPSYATDPMIARWTRYLDRLFGAGSAELPSHASEYVC